MLQIYLDYAFSPRSTVFPEIQQCICSGFFIYLNKTFTWGRGGKIWSISLERLLDFHKVRWNLEDYLPRISAGFSIFSDQTTWLCSFLFWHPESQNFLSLTTPVLFLFLQLNYLKYCSCSNISPLIYVYFLYHFLECTEVLDFAPTICYNLPSGTILKSQESITDWVSCKASFLIYVWLRHFKTYESMDNP